MSKLAELRGGNAAPAKVFSSDVDKSVASVFARMQGVKTAQKKTFEKKVFIPSRFRVEKPTEEQVAEGTIANVKTIVVIDENFTFGMQEHSFQLPSGKWTTERCISAWDTCPLCSKDNVNTYDVVLLTVLDLTPWQTKEGKTVEYTKRVLALKKGDLAAFTGLMGVHGSLRGLMLDMARGTGEKESANGKPTFVKKLTEDELIANFGHPAKLTEKGDKVIVPENDAIFPWNYDKFFPVPSRSDLVRKYETSPRPGSFEESNIENDPMENVKLLDLTEELPEVD